MAAERSSSAWSTDAWREGASTCWRAQAGRLESMLDPVLGPLFARAALQPGDRVLDVGCGRGATTHRAAELVTSTGAVTAVDVSDALIADARALAVDDQDCAAIEWIVEDAQRAALGDGGPFDVVISRFGVMFFDDPVAAFSNLHRATRPGGRLSIATWRPRDSCAFQAVGWQAITRALRAADYEVEDTDPTAGPYAFGVDDTVRATLTGAGWSDVAMHDVELPLYYGGPGSAQDAVDTALGMAGLQAFLDRYDDMATEIAARALLEAFDAHHDGTGVRLDAAILVVTATA